MNVAIIGLEYTQSSQRICFLPQQHHLSERHACRLVGLSRDSYRHPPQPSELNATLGEQIRQTALVRRRFGYRRIQDMLRQQFPGVNHKRIYRLYPEFPS